MISTTESNSDRANISVGDRLQAEAFAKFFRAYLEASDEVREVARDMAAIVTDPNSDSQEAAAALDTLLEALWPGNHDGDLGIDIGSLREVQLDDVKSEFSSFDQDDAVFSDRLKQLMEKQGITQTELADRIGVGQPAISMMLARKCHPQRKTVEQIAEALGVTPDQLWPSSD